MIPVNHARVLTPTHVILPALRTTSCYLLAEYLAKWVANSMMHVLGGKTFLPENMYEKLTKCPNFTQFLPGKIVFCPNLGGLCPPPCPSVSYAYADSYLKASH